MKNLFGILFGCVFGIAGVGHAAPQSLLGGQMMGQAAGALMPASLPVRRDSAVPRRASLFVDREETGLFAPWPERLPEDTKIGEGAPHHHVPLGLTLPGVAGLKDLIALAEAGPKGYDAVQYGARIKTPRPPTQMTIGEIYTWIDATPGQPHAIGRYQMIPPTLRSLVRRVGVPESAMFSPELQDRMADALLQDAGIQEFLSGTISRTAFMNNLAKIWAGLPNSTGRSHYHGYAGNKAVISWTRFQSEMARIFPG